MTLYAKPAPRQSPMTDVGLFTLRCGCGLILLYFHVWSGAFAAWNHVWNEQPWSVIEFVRNQGYPLAAFLTLTAVAFCVFAAIGLIIGFVSRLCAFLVLVVLAGIAPISFRSENPLSPELLVFYALGFFVILLEGAGNYSLDASFRKKRLS